MDIRNLLDYSAERHTSYILGVDDIIVDHLPTQPEYEQNDYQELPKITVVDAQKALELLETFWLQQDGDALGLLKSVQQMKDRVGVTGCIVILNLHLKL